MNKITLSFITILFSGFMLQGCMVTGGFVIESEPVVRSKPAVKKAIPVRAAPPHRKRGKGSVKIPPGHLPPQGLCRIWFDNRPPGHQPPPGNCRKLSRMVPYNAVLIYG
jgi:hypothetical protein